MDTVNHKHILIVDDNPTNVLLIQSILEDHKYKNVYTANSAYEAYDILDKNDIDLILMDVIMPEINGLEATEAIKSNQQFSYIPIIIITASSDDETLKKSFDVGAIDFIRKPINQIELITRLNSVLTSQDKDQLILENSRYQAMEKLIDMIAHQWRQPIAVINTIITTLQAQYELGKLDEKTMVNTLKNITQHTASLSNMITDFRELFSSQSIATLSNPNQAIQESCHLLSSTFEMNNITLELDLDELFELSYPKNLLMQVINHVLTNSLEAFRKDAENKQITIHSHSYKNKINILIKDNAGGISKEVLPYIFEPYYSTKKEKNGKGLGLFLAKKTMNQNLNGDIVANSKDDCTEVLITLQKKVL